MTFFRSFFCADITKESTPKTRQNQTLEQSSIEMEDIYKTPESEVGEDEKVRPHGFWRVFFWVHLVILPILLVMPFFVENLSVYDYIDLGTFIGEIVMLFGYAYSKRIFRASFWKAYLIFYVGWVVAYGFVMPFGFDIPQYGEQTTLDIWFALDPIFYILSISALYFYSFKSPRIWTKF